MIVCICFKNFVEVWLYIWVDPKMTSHTGSNHTGWWEAKAGNIAAPLSRLNNRPTRRFFFLVFVTRRIQVVKLVVIEMVHAKCLKKSTKKLSITSVVLNRHRAIDCWFPPLRETKPRCLISPTQWVKRKLTRIFNKTGRLSGRYFITNII